MELPTCAVCPTFHSSRIVMQTSNTVSGDTEDHKQDQLMPLNNP